MALREYTVYRHIAPNGKCYVGITRQKYVKQRWKKGGKGYASSPLFSKAINKYGWENFKHEILETHIPEELSDEREKYWINFYKANDRKFGYNIEEGGHCRRIVTEETRKKLSAINKGKPKSVEHRKKLSQASTGQHKTLESEVKRIAKIVKPVLQFDLKGNFIQEYPSIKQAAKALNIDNSSITKVCKNKYNQCGGYIWKYKEVL